MLKKVVKLLLAFAVVLVVLIILPSAIANEGSEEVDIVTDYDAYQPETEVETSETEIDEEPTDEIEEELTEELEMTEELELEEEIEDTETEDELEEEELNEESRQIRDIFPDSDLASFIAGLLGLTVESYVVQEDLASITNLYINAVHGLNVNGLNIQSIEGLQYLVNLRRTLLIGHSIADISPLANLTNLVDVYLGDNRIVDVSPLANLTNLDTLWLDANRISNVSPLANLTNLRVLVVNSNEITDVSPLANLINLTDLGVQRNQITDLRPLSNLNAYAIHAMNQTITLPTNGAQIELFFTDGTRITNFQYRYDDETGVNQAFFYMTDGFVAFSGMIY